MDTIYRAKDGTIFEDDSLCEEYELTLPFKESNVKGHYTLLTKDGSLCDIKDLINENCQVSLAFAETSEAWNAINDLFDYMGEWNLPAIGKYYKWSDDTDKWEDIDDLIIKHEDEITNLNNMKESLSELKSVTAW